MLPRLLQIKKPDGTNKYNVLNIDYSNIRGANSVGGSPTDIVGDYLIYDVVASIQAELGEDFIIVRTGGDEFSILTEHIVDKVLETRVQAAARRVKSLYKEGNTIYYKPADVKVTIDDPVDRQKTEAAVTTGQIIDTNDVLVTRIKKFHREMGAIIDGVMSLDDAKEIHNVLGFFTEMLFDQVLDSEIQALHDVGIKNIEVFHDRTDFWII